MAAPVHRSLVQVDFGDESNISRRSDINTSGAISDDVQPRRSDYQYSPDWQAGRSSNAIIHENDDARMTAYSDRLVHRPRRNVRSTNRNSSVYGGNLTSWASNNLRQEISKFNIPEQFGAQNISAQEDSITEASTSQASPVNGEHYWILIDIGPSYRLSNSGSSEASRYTPYESPYETGRRFRIGKGSQDSPIFLLHYSFAINEEDTCEKALSSALKAYHLDCGKFLDCNRFQICVKTNDGHWKHWRILNPWEKPLAILATLRAMNAGPQLRLRLLEAPVEILFSKKAISLVQHTRTYDGLRRGYQFLSYDENEIFEVIKHEFGHSSEIDGNGEDFWLVIRRNNLNTEARKGWVSRTHLLLIESGDTPLSDHLRKEHWVSTTVAESNGSLTSSIEMGLRLRKVRMVNDWELAEVPASLHVPTIVLSGDLETVEYSNGQYKYGMVRFQAVLRQCGYRVNTLDIWPKHPKNLLLIFFKAPRCIKKVFTIIEKFEGGFARYLWEDCEWA